MLINNSYSFQVEIDARKDVFRGLHQFGSDLISKDHFAKQTIQMNLETLAEIESKVRQRGCSILNKALHKYSEVEKCWLCNP